MNRIVMFYRRLKRLYERFRYRSGWISDREVEKMYGIA
jgi:hypothetical protein